MPVTLTPQQRKVSDALTLFALKGGAGQKYMAVSGYAGTGKTTVLGMTAARCLREKPRMAVAWCSPTGKAAQALRDRLQTFGGLNEHSTVGTVHSLIYRLSGRKNGRPQWARKSEPLPFDLVVIDEASMVTRGMFRDILAYGVPVVFVGDSGQLPPVGDDGVFAPLETTEHRLTEVHRQALENPIVRWATEVRNGGSVPLYSERTFARLKRGSSVAQSVTRRFLERGRDSGCMVLCGRNRTRVTLNRTARSTLGFSGPLPQSGERMICLENMRIFSIYNGQLFTVEKDSENFQGSAKICYTLYLEGQLAFTAYTGALMARDGEELRRRLAEDAPYLNDALRDGGQERPALFDFGYACSVHKAQGSEWDNVLLFDERMGNAGEDAYRRWLYTGMTRAREKLCIVS